MSELPETQRILRFGDFTLDPRTGELCVNGKLTILPKQPLHLLMTLLDRPGQLVTREGLQKELWSCDTFVDFDQGLNKAVNRLREALDDDADHPRYIETLHRRGYRYVGPVPINSAQNAEAGSPPSSQPALRAEERSSQSFATSWSTGGRKYWTAAVLVTFAFGAAVFSSPRWFLRSRALSLEKAQIRKLTDNGRSEDVAISPDGRYLAYALHRGEKYSLLLRQFATQSEIEILPPDAGSFHGMTFSPDGNYLYFVRTDKNDSYFKNLYRMPALGGIPRKLATDVDSPASFSPDGREMAYEHNDLSRSEIELIVAKADGSSARVLTTFHDANGYMYDPGPSWSPDGKVIVLPVMLLERPLSWVMETVSVSDGRVRELYSSQEDMGRPGWLPKGETILFALNDSSLRSTQLWALSFPGGDAIRLTNGMGDYGAEMGITRDGAAVATIVRSARSNLWTVSLEPTLQDQQLTFDDATFLNIAERADGSLLAVGGDHQLWSMSAAGAQRSLFAEVHKDGGGIAVCGSSVVFTAIENGTQALVRVHADGTAPVKLASGLLLGSPSCSPDNQWVYYLDLAKEQKVWRISIDGGIPEKVGETPAGIIIKWLSVSPDGKLLSYAYTQYVETSAPGWSIAVEPVGGGAARRFKLPGDSSSLRWSPTGKAIQFVMSRDGSSNIWEQPLSSTGVPRQVTRFSSGEIFDFIWLAKEEKFVVVRGEVGSDVVLITGLR